MIGDLSDSCARSQWWVTQWVIGALNSDSGNKWWRGSDCVYSLVICAQWVISYSLMIGDLSDSCARSQWWVTQWVIGALNSDSGNKWWRGSDCVYSLVICAQWVISYSLMIGDLSDSCARSQWWVTQWVIVVLWTVIVVISDEGALIVFTL
jgi:amino acid permease